MVDPDQRQMMTQALQEMNEQFEPFIEAAEGYKRKMMACGWSEANAEVVATELLKSLMATAFKAIR